MGRRWYERCYERSLWDKAAGTMTCFGYFAYFDAQHFEELIFPSYRTKPGAQPCGGA